MDKRDYQFQSDSIVPDLTDRRDFLTKGVVTVATFVLGSFFARNTAAAAHRYKLAPESILPPDIRKALDDVREAYRFALANRNTLRYVPCYCGCGEQGHTSNASCYFTDDSTPQKPVFDRMSLG
jgi:hypothetical protein